MTVFPRVKYLCLTGGHETRRQCKGTMFNFFTGEDVIEKITQSEHNTNQQIGKALY